MNKFLIRTLSITTALSMLSGCGAKTVTPKNLDETTIKEVETDENLVVSNADTDILSSIAAKYASSEDTNKNDFKKAIYNLPKDYVFEFDCNTENLKNKYYDTFGVYVTPDYKSSASFIRNCAEISLKDGKIYIKPGVVDVFYDINEDTITKDTNTYSSWKTENNGTWGNLNKLYLVQKLDLETGDTLDKPIITPFSVNHDVESVALKQKVDKNNNYYLSWNEVEGASSYLVYKIEDTSYKLVYKTKELKATSDQFSYQLHINELDEIVNKELEENGYDVTTTQKLTMNNDLHSKTSPQFTVVAVKDGITSGMSNIVDSNEVANSLPYSIKDKNIEITINSVLDMPTTIEVETVNGNTMDMIINYHGSVLKSESDDSTTFYILPYVLNTDLSPFLITVHGMKYADFKKDAQKLPERQDKLTGTLPKSNPEIEVDVPNVPEKDEIVSENNNENKNDDKNTSNTNTSQNLPENIEENDGKTEDNKEDVKENTISEEKTEKVQETKNPENKEPIVEDNIQKEDENKVVENTSQEKQISDKEEVEEETTAVAKTSKNEIFNETALYVDKTIKDLENKSGVSIDKVLYANSPLEEWIAYCLIARSELIPVPSDYFDNASDTDMVTKIICEAYRQNPMSGMISNLGYSYTDETYVVKYADDTNDRLEKQVKELKKAKEVVEKIAPSGSDYDKVIALNNYFLENASYDFDSAQTDVDMDNLSQSFIDAHTPYGILCENYGVCESYSESFVLTGRLAGLEVLAEVGDLYGAGGHEWNRVKIDGSWCILDITNNDSQAVYNGLCNISEKEAKNLLIPNNTAFIVDASANTDSFEYYRKNDNYADTTEQLTEKLEKQLDTKNTAAVRFKESISKEDFRDVAQTLYNDGYVLSDAYSMFNVVVVTK